MKQKGFSLIETFIVIVILGIISALTIPFLWGAREESEKRKKAAKAMATVLTNSRYKVLSKVSIGTGQENIVLEDLTTGERYLLLTCDDEQKKIVTGDTVQFELDGNYKGSTEIACGLITRRVS